MKDKIKDIITDYRNKVYCFVEDHQQDTDNIEDDVDGFLDEMEMEILKLFKENEAILPKNYLVYLEIRDGEFEKSSKHLIHFVDTEEEAIEYAIRAESHDREDNTPPDEYGWYEDCDGELMYRVEKVVEVSAADFEVLKKYN